MESEGIGPMTPLIPPIGGNMTLGASTTSSLLYPASTPPPQTPHLWLQQDRRRLDIGIGWLENGQIRQKQLQKASLEQGQVDVQLQEGVQKDVFGLDAVGVKEGHIAVKVGKERKEAVSKQQGQGTWDLTQNWQTYHPLHLAITLGTLEVISPVSCCHYQLKFLALVIPYPKELVDEPWADKDDEWQSSPPPPIPFPVDIEIKARVAQSNEGCQAVAKQTLEFSIYMDYYGKFLYDFVALGFCLLEQLKI